MQKRDMHSRVEDALDKVRPALRADGETQGRSLRREERVRQHPDVGACKGCPLSQLDFVYAIDSLIRREVPEVREIVAV